MITPHLGGATRETLLQGAEMIADEIRRFAAGEELVNVVNRSEVASRMSDELLLAIDAGTGSCRAVLFDSDGSQIAIGQREYMHPELAGLAGLSGLRHRGELASDLRMRARGARILRGLLRARLRSQRDQHARGDGALRRARPRDLGLPERRLAGRRRGRRAGPLRRCRGDLRARR